MIMLKHVSVFLAGFNLLAVIALLFFCRKALMTSFRETGKAALILLAGIFIAQATTQIFMVAPKHLVYIDEFWYMQAGRDILARGFAPSYDKAIGWPLLCSLSYIIGGLNNYSPIYLNIFLSFLVPLAGFAAARMLLKSDAAAAITAAFCAFLPYKMVWAASAETGTISLLFVLCALYASLLYYRTREKKVLWLAAAFWAYSAQIRPENLMFLALFAAGGLLLGERASLKEILAPALCAIAVNAANFLVFAAFQSSTNWVQNDSGGQLTGSNLSLHNLLYNTVHWAPRLVDTSLHPLLFTLIFLTGAVLLFRENRKVFYFLAVWLGLNYVFYFSAWFQVYGTTLTMFPKTKIYMFFYPPLMMCAAYALAKLVQTERKSIKAAGIFLAILTVGAMFAYSKNASFRDTRRELETRLVADADQIPDECTVITHAPVILQSVNHVHTVFSGEIAESEPHRRALTTQSPCLLYLQDITLDMPIDEFKRYDQQLRGQFVFSQYAVYSLNGVTYRYYKLSPR